MLSFGIYPLISGCHARYEPFFKKLNPVIQILTHFGPAAIPELVDRIIAATAVHLKLPLLTTDASIEASERVQTVW